MSAAPTDRADCHRRHTAECMSLKTRITTAFSDRYSEAPTAIVRAPGRVNLIGEHTDYNDGFVLPMAIDRAVWIALRPRGDRQVSVHALTFDQTRTFGLDGLSTRETATDPNDWMAYIEGTAWSLCRAGHPLIGWEGVMAGDVPIGAGLSSSAALELATARAFAAIGDLPWAPTAMAKLGQRAEIQWVGVRCGIMDQMISAAGLAGHALLLDCRTLDYTPVPLPDGVSVLVLDTGTRRGLVGSAYNQRRRQCEAAALHFGVPALRDVSAAQLEAQREALDDVTYRRARHVVNDNARVQRAASAMMAGDAPALGALMNASHESLARDFEVSSEALDAMVACARTIPGCLGARMTGAGFGGCAVALVETPQAPAFAESVSAAYRERTGHDARVYVCTASDGAAVMGQSGAR